MNKLEWIGLSLVALSIINYVVAIIAVGRFTNSRYLTYDAAMLAQVPNSKSAIVRGN